MTKLAEPEPPTVAEALARGLHVWGRCPKCGWSRQAFGKRLEIMLAQFGADLSIAALRDRTRCSTEACGHRPVTITVEIDPVDQPAQPSYAWFEMGQRAAEHAQSSRANNSATAASAAKNPAANQ